MPWKSLLLLVIFQSFAVASEIAFNCGDIRQAQLSLSIHSANLANAITTRTPEGGAYKRKEIRKTEGGEFKIVSIEDSRLVYEPSHPDANENGYVAYPNVNLSIERAGIETGAKKLKLLALAKVCGTSILDSKLSSVIKYGQDNEISSDAFIFTRNGMLLTWTRGLKTGEEQILNF